MGFENVTLKAAVTLNHVFMFVFYIAVLLINP